MLKAFKGLFTGIVIFILSTGAGYGQVNLSPYTIIGLGDLNSNGLTTNAGMGGLGVSNGQNWYLNNINPALLTRNNFTVLEAGMVFESRYLRNNAGLSQENSGGGINYFAMAFPVKPGIWTTSVGIMPYSTVNYNILSSGTVNDREDVPITFNYTGEGGLSQAYFSNGLKLNKNLSIGIKASLLFGSIINQTVAVPGDTSTFIQYNSAVYDQTTIKGWTFGTGLTYRIELKDKTFLNTGFTYDFGSKLNAKKFKTFEARTGVSFDPISVDTLVNRESGEINLPSSYAFGISYEKLYKLVVGADVHVHNWSQFRNFDQGSETMVDNFGVNIGAEYVPDATSVDSYFKRVVYRIGFDYQKTPFEAMNNQLNDFGINFGASFPVKGLSSINLAAKFGQRGTTDDNLIRENYFRIYFGISFNDRWFQRRVLN